MEYPSWEAASLVGAVLSYNESIGSCLCTNRLIQCSSSPSTSMSRLSLRQLRVDGSNQFFEKTKTLLLVDCCPSRRSGPFCGDDQLPPEDSMMLRLPPSSLSFRRFCSTTADQLQMTTCFVPASPVGCSSPCRANDCACFISS